MLEQGVDPNAKEVDPDSGHSPEYWTREAKDHEAARPLEEARRNVAV